MTSHVPPDLGGPLVDIRNTFGAVLLGGTTSIGLLGITTLQAWLYYNNYPGDHRILKLLVAGIWIIEFVRSTLTVHATWHYLVLNWGNPFALTTIIWSLSALALTTNIGEVVGHMYFAWRIWMLSAGRLRWTLTSISVILGLWNFGMGLATYITSLRATSITGFADGPQKILSPFALGTAMATDLSVTLSLIFLLNRRRTGFSKTNRLINTLIFYAIQIGVITVAARIAIIILNHYISKIGFDYIGVYGIVGNLYANSLLASLNARIGLRPSGTIDMSTTSGWPAMNPRSQGVDSHGRSQHSQAAYIASLRSESGPVDDKAMTIAAQQYNSDSQSAQAV